MTRDETRELWREGDLSCLMISCCSGAELQVRRADAEAATEKIVLRELYPTKSDLYDRARDLRLQFAAGDHGALGPQARALSLQP